MPTEDLAQNTTYVQLNRGVTEAEKSIQAKYPVLTALFLKKSTCMLYHTSILFHQRFQLNVYFCKDQSLYFQAGQHWFVSSKYPGGIGVYFLFSDGLYNQQYVSYNQSLQYKIIYERIRTIKEAIYSNKQQIRMTEFLSKLPENTIKNTNQQDSSPMSVVLPSAPIPLLCL